MQHLDSKLVVHYCSGTPHNAGTWAVVLGYDFLEDILLHNQNKVDHWRTMIPDAGAEETVQMLELYRLQEY